MCTCILEKRKEQSNKFSIIYSIKWKTEKNTPPSNDSKSDTPPTFTWPRTFLALRGTGTTMQKMAGLN